MIVYNDELYHYGVKGMKHKVKKTLPVTDEKEYRIFRLNPNITQPNNDQYHVLRSSPNTTPTSNDKYHMIRTGPPITSIKIDKRLSRFKNSQQLTTPSDKTQRDKNKQLKEYHKNSGKEILSKLMNR